MTVSFWNERFSAPEYAYGTKPNDFVAQMAARISKGAQVLSLAEGEGRNAVFLAQQGLNVTAVDSSEVGLRKAEKLAKDKNVRITTVCADVFGYEIGENRWDAIVSIWFHMPKAIRERVHRACARGLKSGGVFLLEAYTPAQLQYKSGGPPDLDLLMSKAEFYEQFAGFEFLHAQEKIREIHEGVYHHGPSAVVQILARKP